MTLTIANVDRAPARVIRLHPGPARCGHRARMPRGPALLARKAGVPLVPVTLDQRSDR